MISILHSLLISACILQGAPPDSPAVRGQWNDIDRVVAIVNQDIITWRQLMRDFKREFDSGQLTNESEIHAAQTKILTGHVKNLLRTQAGQDLGADPKAVERTVQDWFDRTVQSSNGVVGMSNVLQSQDMTTQDVKRGMRERIYGNAWSDSITGEGPGVATRPSRDRYVRPGQIRFRYEEALRRPEALRSIGGSNEMFTLQVLMLDSDKHGGKEKTLALAKELKLAIESGTDMSELVRRYGMPGANDGVGEPADLARIQLLFPAAAEFVRQRPKDDALLDKYVSEPLVIMETGGRVLYQLARIRLRVDGLTPKLSSPDVQRTLALRTRDDLDAFRLDRAYARLHRAAYVWPPEYSAQPER
ncbi:MAG: hypothetical protein JNL28_02450 [Planctomycetes bacterium]|nr:hypothetical protein [Planctomycetota bacterium]